MNEFRLLLVPGDLWSKPLDDGSPGLDACSRQIAECGRRLSKGTDRAQQERLLLDSTGVLRRLAGRLLEAKAVRPFLVPAELAVEWAALLGELAHASASPARLLPPFLPCVFSPASYRGGAQVQAGQYGELTVASHLERLKDLDGPAAGWRKQRFATAVSEGCGIVETAMAVFPRLAPGTQKEACDAR
jgi:hypothetical protein